MTSTPAIAHGRSTGAGIWIPLIALWIVWGSTYIGIAVTGRTMPPLMAAGARFAGAFVILALIVAVTRGPRALAITWAQARSTAVMGIMILGVGIGTLSLAERYVPSGIAALIVAVMPMWIVIFRLRAGDRPARMTLIGVTIGLAGLATMLLPGGTDPVNGTDTDVALWSLAIVCSSFSWALFSWRARTYDVPANSLVTAIYEMVFAAAFLISIGLLRGERLDVATIPSEAWWSWGWLIVASVIGYSAFSFLLSHARMSLMSTYAFVNPVVAVILGMVLLHEPLTRDVAVGLTVVVGGVCLIVLGERDPA